MKKKPFSPLFIKVLKPTSLLVWLAGLVSCLLPSCNPENEVRTNRTIELAFSSDTVLFDTVFTSVGSITRRLKVFNPDKNAVEISEIKVAGGAQSPFRVVINGSEGPSDENSVLLGGDSLLVLISVTIDPNDADLPFIIKDSLKITNGELTQDVKLVSWGQNANFLSDSVLSCNTSWNADRPYVIYNSILIDSLCTLSIEPGTQIYSHPGSYIFVKGTLRAEGTSDQRVVFTNDRKDGYFRDAPGQWEGIYFLEGSSSNLIKYTDIRNAVLGIRLGAPDQDTIPDVVLSETRIENMSEYGILTFTSDLSATNTLINSCRLGCVSNLAGGHYRYEHCTFANLPVNFSAEGPTVVFSDNLLLGNNQVLEADFKATVINTIIWGHADEEITLSATGKNNYLLITESNLLKTKEDLFNQGNNVLNKDPLFTDPSLYNYHLSENSPAIDKGTPNLITTDLEGNPRINPPDIGAYEKQ